MRNLFIIIILISLFGCGGGSDEPNEMNQETEPSENTKPTSEGKYDLHLMNNSYSANVESDNEYNVLLVTDL